MARLQKGINFGARSKSRISRSLQVSQTKIGPSLPITFEVRSERITSKPRMTRQDKWKKRLCVERWYAWKDLIAMSYKRAGGHSYFQPIAIGYEFHLLNHRKIDLDNLIKGCNDALNGLAWPDDNVGYVRQFDYARVIFDTYGPFCGSEKVIISIRPLD